MKFCSKCGSQIQDEAVVCIHCGCSTETAPAPAAKKTSGLIITGFIFSFLIALLGLIFCIAGLINLGKDPTKGGKGLAIAGIIIAVVNMVLGAIMQAAGLY